MPVVGPVAQVVDGDVEQPDVAGLAGQGERRAASKYAGKIVTTSILTAASASSSGNGVTRPGRSATTTRPAGDVDLGHERGDERHQRVAAVGGADLEEVLGAVEDAVTSPSERPSRSSAARPTSWWS